MNNTFYLSDSDFVSLSEYGYDRRYILLPTGEVYNTKSNKFLKMNNHNYCLKLKTGKYQSIALRTLYRLAYGEYFVIDTIEDLPGEEWRQTKQSNKHFVSNFGRIKSLEHYNAKILQPCINNKGYYRIQICNKDYLVHRIVAEAFIPNTDPENKPYVDHIDENKLNNNVNNLQWVSNGENRRLHYDRVGRKRDKKQ